MTLIRNGVQEGSLLRNPQREICLPLCEFVSSTGRRDRPADEGSTSCTGHQSRHIVTPAHATSLRYPAATREYALADDWNAPCIIYERHRFRDHVPRPRPSTETTDDLKP
jgi:hypothetical protein